MHHVSVYINQIKREGNTTVRRVEVKFNHTVSLSPHKTIFHEAYIYGECAKFQVDTIYRLVKLSVEKKKNTHRKLEHNMTLAQEMHKTLFLILIIETMHILKLICLFKLMNHGKAKEHDQ